MLHFFATTTPVAPPPVVVPGYLDPSELVAHIRVHNLAIGEPWRDIGIAADLAYIEANDRLVDPAVYVVPVDETGSDRSDMKVIRQEIECTVQVVSVIRHYRIDAGESASASLGPLRLQLRKHIVGFKPGGFNNSLRFRRGRLMRYTDELQVWVDEFVADYHFQKFIN